MKSNRLPDLDTWLLPWTLPWRSMQAASAWLDVAPEVLQQSINSGWTFGNLVVNAGNSAAPDTERAIVAEASYGRQIGRTMDAVAALLCQLDGPERQKAIDDFTELRARIERTKHDMKVQRAERLVEDVKALKASDAAAYEQLRAALLAVLER